MLPGSTSAGQGRSSVSGITSRMAGKSHVSPQSESATIECGVRLVGVLCVTEQRWQLESPAQKRSSQHSTGVAGPGSSSRMRGSTPGWVLTGELDLWINKTLMCSYIKEQAVKVWKCSLSVYL